METVRHGISLETVLRFVDVATDALAAAREEIDALNVYPVPDGDTGTNMFLTVSAARDAIRGAVADGADFASALTAFSRGALLGARGNSGVILSQLLGGIASRLSAATPEERNAVVMADALRLATDASYVAVGAPVEGTMLTVARAASDAALSRAAEPGARARDVFSVAAAAAREALARTPDQLKVLADAGVVDAGGRGVCVVLDAAETVLTGRVPPAVVAQRGVPRIPTPVSGHALRPDGPAYEVMYLLDADDAAIPALKTALSPLGDSLVVVGGEGLWNVHVHVDDVGAAIEAGIRAGRPHRVRVTHFADQAPAVRRRGAARTGRRIVAVAAGPGLARLFEEAGAVVVQGGPGKRPSSGQLLEAITACGAAEVVVLPNDPDSVRVAEIAARTAEESGDLRVVIIPTRAQVQGLAAAAVHEPGRSLDADVLEMTATARHARHGAVTVAARKAITMAGPCEPGDVLGVVAGDFAAVGDDLYDVATGVLDRLLGGGGELVTIVSGCDDGAEGLGQRCAAFVESSHPHVDVVVYDGGQARYPLLMSVE
ncbi:DAK2 domain-containing protein [Nocardioides sp. LHG3406-4]|uniref:DAK2 domain-containing protein n=1 Tax=Nocardioides sp. LHG3406-4 TaxID=2804575 RepID=UPI003CF75464